MNETDGLEFSELFSGKTKPVTYKITFLISNFADPAIIATDGLEWLIEDSIGSNLLSDILDESEIKKVPSEVGAYVGELTVMSFRSNHPQDPEEWDMNITLENVKRIELKYD